jgi:ADP-ribose pyrophosphatase
MKITSQKILHEGRYLRFILSSYTDKNGIVHQWESFQRVHCKGIAVIVPVTHENEVLLVRQFRPPLNGYVIEFPAGLNDKGETLEQAARRELIEETGYAAGELVFLTDGPMSSGASGEILTGYLAKDLRFRGVGERDETEDIEVLKIPIPDLETTLSKLRDQGNYIDLKIYGLLALALKHL